MAVSLPLFTYFIIPYQWTTYIGCTITCIGIIERTWSLIHTINRKIYKNNSITIIKLMRKANKLLEALGGIQLSTYTSSSRLLRAENTSMSTHTKFLTSFMFLSFIDGYQVYCSDTTATLVKQIELCQTHIHKSTYLPPSTRAMETPSLWSWSQPIQAQSLAVSIVEPLVGQFLTHTKNLMHSLKRF